MDDLFIITVFREEWEHPDVGHEVRIKGKVVRITRVETRPSGFKKFFVENINGNKPYIAKK